MAKGKNVLERLRCAWAGKDEKAAQAVLDEMPAGTLRLLTNDAAGDEGAAVQGVHHNYYIGGEPGKAGNPGAPSGDRKWTDSALDEQFGKLEKSADERHKGVMDAIAKLAPAHDAESEEEKKKKEEEEKKSADAESKKEKEIEGEIEAEAQAGTGDVAKKAKDSIYLADSFQETVSLCEVIAPGISVPTFDQAANPTKTVKEICGLRKKALKLGNNEPSTNALIEKANGGRPMTGDSIDKMSCDSVRPLFNAVAAMKKEANVAGHARESARTKTSDGPKPIASIADMNKANAEFWKQPSR